MEEDLIIDLEQGKLLGKTALDSTGKVYYSFQGIPYAKPPLGNLRFKAPQPPEKWVGIRDATKEGSECYSDHSAFQHRVGSEDCLFLNVYTPQFRAQGRLKPVMVWIHGGGFTSGSGNSEMYGPDYLIAQDVLVVSINYRYGVLGFLSLEDPNLGVPGNAGLKDQVMALRWIQKNIRHFGGDPKNVTIFGESAGSISVHHLVLSPMAKGLFHKAIAQSGCSLNTWAFGERLGRKLAEILKFESTSESEILSYLQKIPVDELYEAQRAIKDGFIAGTQRPFGPTLEQISPYEPAFLAEKPLGIILQGKYNKVPLILGYNDREGMMHEIIYAGKNALITDFEDCVPCTWLLPKGSPKSKLIARKIKEFYYGSEEPTANNKDILFKMQTDGLFFREIRKSAQLHAQTSSLPVFLYRFSFDGELNVYKKFCNLTHPGACHADELAYIFKINGVDYVDLNSDEGRVSQFLVRLWTNFAKHGNPNPPKPDGLIDVVWKPVANGQLHFLDIDRMLTSRVNPEAERSAFWDEVYSLTQATSKL